MFNTFWSTSFLRHRWCQKRCCSRTLLHPISETDTECHPSGTRWHCGRWRPRPGHLLEGQVWRCLAQSTGHSTQTGYRTCRPRLPPWWPGSPSHSHTHSAVSIDIYWVSELKYIWYLPCHPGQPWRCWSWRKPSPQSWCTRGGSSWPPRRRIHNLLENKQVKGYLVFIL